MLKEIIGLVLATLALVTTIIFNHDVIEAPDYAFEMVENNSQNGNSEGRNKGLENIAEYSNTHNTYKNIID